MTRRRWTEAEVALLRDLYPDIPAAELAALLDRPAGQVHQAAARHGLSKSAAFLAGDRSGRIQRARTDPRMLATQFRPGMTPWNKGLKGLQIGGLATRFKPGHLPRNWVPIGSYRLNADGYLDQKITDEGRGPRDWEAVHRLVWIAAHGPIPPGHIVRFKAGRKTTVLEQITLEALECISRAEHARRNHPRNKSPELARLVQLKGAITRQVNRINREAAQADEQIA